MKQIILILFIATLTFHALGQSTGVKQIGPEKKEQKLKRAHYPAFYITTSTGINNNTGVLGFSFDVPVSKNISIDAGVGAGSWNNKIYAGVKYYLDPFHRGFAFGTGLTYSSGLSDDRAYMTTIYGNNEWIEYNKNPQTNILFAAYKYWNMGKKYNRWYVELGWSVRVTGGSIVTQLTGDPLDRVTLNTLELFAPGGLIAGVGMSFGVH